MEFVSPRGADCNGCLTVLAHTTGRILPGNTLLTQGKRAYRRKRRVANAPHDGGSGVRSEAIAGALVGLRGGGGGGAVFSTAAT